MENHWRYFRLGGDPPIFRGDHLFTVRIHHGGRFYSNGGVNRQYRGAEGVVYVDGVDPHKISVTGFNYWAYDLGYTHGPIKYWYRIPGSEPGTGYLPVVTDADAMDMLQFIPSRDRILDVYFVCLAGRRHFQDWELDHFDDEVEHLLYLGHFIEDLPLSTLEEEQLGPVGEDADQGGSDVKDHVIGQDGGNGGPSNAPTDGPRSGASRPTHVPSNAHRRQVSRRRPTVRINIREPSALVQGSQASVQVSGLTTNSAKEKGKQKLDEVGKKKGKKPKKAVARRYETRGGGECSYAAPEDDGWSSKTTDSDDPNYDGFVDSDYELFDEEDEVLFEKNVDGDPSKVAEWEEMGFEGNISDAEADDSDGFPSIHGSDSDDEDLGPFKVKSKKRFSDWKEFNPRTDMKDPRFEIGMLFPSSVIFKKAVRKHAVLIRKELRFEKNTRHKVKVVCKTSPGCPFWIYASSPSKNTPSLMIKVYKPNHQCSSIEGRVYHCHAPFIAEEYMDQFMVDGKWSREGIQNAVNRDFGMDIGYQMCYRAKRRVARMAQGSYEDQYNILESYANKLKKRNPGTSVWIQIEIEGEVTRFKRIYICFEALKQGWRAGCRPILGLDGCHLKGAHKGQLLSAVGIDGNNGIYPVAYAIVETENRDSWTWFLTFMREDLQIYSSIHYAFISDKQKGLEQAIKDLFPHSEHRHCVRHLHNNFKGDGHSGLALKQLFWGVARLNTMTQYNRVVENLQNASYNAWKWCADRPASHWSRSHFSDKLKCDILHNNHSESFNKSLLEARKKPIILYLEDIRIALMVRLNNRRNSAAKWRCNVGPRIEKLLKKNATWSHDYRALQSSEHRFELQGRGVACESGVISQHSVQLDMKSCNCRRWDLSGLPCGHVIAALYSKGWSPDDFVSKWYTKKKYLEAYEVVINPIAGVAEWEKKDRPIAPLLYRRQPGRPKSKRTKEPGEEPPPAGVERLPESYYSQITCGTCHQKGHNKRTCQRRNQGGNAAGETQVSQVHVQPENDAHNVQPTAENTEDVHIPDGEPLPTQESTFDNAHHFQSQASSAMPPSMNENQNVNLNVNVNVNLNIYSGGIDGNTMFSQTTNNVVHPSSETEQMHQGSPARPATSGKRVKRTAGRKFIARKSPRLAAAFASASIQAPKPKLQRALWKP